MFLHSVESWEEDDPSHGKGTREAEIIRMTSG